jgi:hypothetical protein
VKNRHWAELGAELAGLRVDLTRPGGIEKKNLKLIQ